MHKKVSTISILLLLILNFPVSSQQYSSKTLELKTTRYELKVKVDYEAEKVYGECRLSVLNPTDKPISHVPLLLYRLLKVTAIMDDQGTAIPHQQNVLSFEDWEQLQVNYVEVKLPEPLESNQSKTIAIHYEGFLFGYSKDSWCYVRDHIDKEFTFMRMDGYGYPVVGYPCSTVNRRSGLQSFDYTLSVTVPKDLVVANGGKLTSKSTIDGQSSYTYINLKPAWRLDMPIAPYGIFFILG